MDFGTYLLIRRFDDKLDLILSKLDGLTGGDAEKEALRQQVAALIAAANISAEEKAALAAKIDAAYARSEVTEAKMRAAVPT